MADLTDLKTLFDETQAVYTNLWETLRTMRSDSHPPNLVERLLESVRNLSFA